MATYKEIKGVTIQTRDEDPTVNAGTWASGGDLNTGRNEGGGAGIQTAALMFGGRSPSFQDLTESYNGTSWTEVNDMSSPVAYLQSAGVVYTAALGIGGHRTTAATANNESWDGTNWTEVADLNSARSFGGSNGSATSALIYGGVDPTYPPQTAKTESWDGSSWTETGDLNTAREGMVGFGFNNSNAISAGGSGTPTAVESFDGSSWTEIAEINTGRTAAGAFGAYNDGIVCGGSPGDTVNTEAWNGTAWTEVNNLANGRNSIDSGIGSPSSEGIVFGGYSSSTYRAFTEEWSFPSGPHLNEGDIFLSGGTTLKGFGKAAGIPAATWSSGGSLNTGRFGLGAAGSQTANLVFAGGIPSPPQTNITESYNGTSWTEVNDMQRSTAVYLAGTGTQTAALGMAGENTTVRLSVVESWDGTNWTEIADVNTARGTTYLDFSAHFQTH